MLPQKNFNYEHKMEDDTVKVSIANAESVSDDDDSKAYTVIFKSF